MLSVGQKLWFVPRRGEAQEVEVIKVDRKWAYISGSRPDLRVDVETLSADGRGYSSPGQCHMDREAYELDVTRRKEWSEWYGDLGPHPRRRT